MTVPVVTASAADVDIRRTDAWWRENRATSSDLFLNELSKTLALLAIAPLLGRRYPRRKIPGLRRLLLRQTRQHVYDVFDGTTVTVLALQSALRRRGPTLAGT